MSLSTSISFSCLCFYGSHSLTTHSKWKSFGRKNLSSSLSSNTRRWRDWGVRVKRPLTLESQPHQSYKDINSQTDIRVNRERDCLPCIFLLWNLGVPRKEFFKVLSLDLQQWLPDREGDPGGVGLKKLLLLLEEEGWCGGKWWAWFGRRRWEATWIPW